MSRSDDWATRVLDIEQEYYAGFDDLPPDARQMIANSKWLGFLTEYQLQQIPKGADITERLRQCDRILTMGSNNNPNPFPTAVHGQMIYRVLRMRPHMPPPPEEPR